MNADQPTTFQHRTIHAGNDFVSSLVQKKTFDWHQTSQAEAAEGLRKGAYYLVVSVPADFSSNLISGAGDDPRRAKITIRRNDANGFVVGSITNSAQNSITRTVDESAQASYFDAVFANLEVIRSGLQDASSGAQKLATGATWARDGAAKLDTGAASAAKGAKQVSSGASSLNTGLATAKTGSATLSKGLKTLDTRSGQLATGAASVATGTQQLSDTVLPPLTTLGKALPELRTGARQAGAALQTVADTATGRTKSVAADLDDATAQLAELKKAHPELADDPSFTAVGDHLDDASGRADDIATATKQGATTLGKINTTLNGKDDLATKVKQAKTEITDLNDGAQAVSTGAAKLHTGIGTADDGAGTLATGISTAAAGAKTLAGGAADLSDGSTRWPPAPAACTPG